MTATITDITDFSPAEVKAFNSYVRQSLSFVNTTEEQAAKTIFLSSAYSAASRTIRDRRQPTGSTR